MNRDRMQHFAALTRDEQAAAMRQLAAAGMSDYGLAHATGLAVEMVRAVLSASARPTDSRDTHDFAHGACTQARASSVESEPLAYPDGYPSRPALSPERTRSERG